MFVVPVEFFPQLACTLLNIWGGEAVHAEGVGDLAAVMDVVLDDVPDDPSAGVGVYLAFPLILDRRLQI